MQIVIPMSGFGERFRRAGYSLPKPLIAIDGKPIIAHVIDLFPGARDFIFICNQDHLDHPDYRMRATLNHYCPSGRIIGIAPHKLGPVHAVRQIEDSIDSTRPVLVNYCDFTCYWDWDHFKTFVAETRCDGAIPAYRGFHPHSLGTTNYAYMRETAGWVQDIQEKQPYTDNRLNEFASSGTYYFASGQIMKDAFRQTMDQGLQVGGEYYVSLTYKPILAGGGAVAVYPLQHFMQWGTPEDVADYRAWSDIFRRSLTARHPSDPSGSLIVPMAGLGQRFANEGYQTVKPLIPVSGKPMVIQAASDLPPASHQVFVLRSDMPGHREISARLIAEFPGAMIETLPQVTEGQACTALIGLDALTRTLGDVPGPVTVGACDNGVLYDEQALGALLNNPDIDVLVWGIRGHRNAVQRPAMFGWIQEKDGRIDEISVKTPLSSPATDPIVLGTFTFRRAGDLRRSIDRLVARNGRINGEFYLDSAINDAIALGLRCHLFDVDAFMSWGTPDDLRIYEYWQSCFHKWPGHPYRLEKDPRVDPQALPDLETRYRKTLPAMPEAVRIG